MPILPRTGRWPRRLPDTEEAYYYVDNRNTASDKMDRSGPFVGTFIPTGGDLQIPSSGSSEPILVTIDARVWLPITSGAKQRSVLTNVQSNVAYGVVYAPRWGDMVECFVVRRSPS